MTNNIVEFLSIHDNVLVRLTDCSSLQIFCISQDYYYTIYTRRQFKNKLPHIYETHVNRKQLVKYLNEYPEAIIEKEVQYNG